ncbi:MAG: hypothetical protein RDU83_08670 [bacterium]|nr:hypothetical protein [bacterium]
MRSKSVRLLATAVSLLVLTTAAGAQQQEVRPPIAQLWIDVATNTFAMPGVPVPIPVPPGGQAGNAFGNTRSAIGRYVDVALHTRARPQGTQASQTIPAAMRMGASLPLEPVRAEPATGGPEARGPGEVEQPKGRLLFYWGCGADVRAGQPRVLDFARASPQDWAAVWEGRFAPERGARAQPGYSIWPNERDRRMLPDGASLQGDHAVTGEGVPAGLRFAIGPNQDLMPAIDLSAQGDPQASIPLRWRQIQAARAYFINAFGAKGSDFIIWSSSELPDAGMGLFDYLSNANIERWTNERVLLPASATQCAVPRGIFGGTDGAMVRMIAYGQELNLVHPPRPADPRVAWEQEWAVRVRVKGTVMTLLGVGR